MSTSCGTRFSLTAIVFIAALAVFLVRLEGMAFASEEFPGEVRMAVDPTVLPPVQPESAPVDEAEAPVAAETAKQDAPVDKVEDPEAEEAEVPAEKMSAPAPESQPMPTGKGAVQSVAVSSTGNRLVLTVVCDRPVGDTSYMNLSSPSRLVIDLRQPWALKTKNVVRADQGAVKHVVAGVHPDRLRLVVHFRTPPNGHIEPVFVRDGNKLIVTADVP